MASGVWRQSLLNTGLGIGRGGMNVSKGPERFLVDSDYDGAGPFLSRNGRKCRRGLGREIARRVGWVRPRSSSHKAVTGRKSLGASHAMRRNSMNRNVWVYSLWAAAIVLVLSLFAPAAFSLIAKDDAAKLTPVGRCIPAD